MEELSRNRDVSAGIALERATAQDPAMRGESLMTSSERELVLFGFNATAADYPRNGLIHELVEEQAARSPGAVAVIYAGLSLTYGDLNAQANRLAHYLLQRGMQIGEYVPLLMERCPQMLVAQLAVLKCGGAYVPLDPKMPAQRRTHLLHDCGARRIVGQGGCPKLLESEPFVWLDCTQIEELVQAMPADNPGLSIPRPAAAYVMYTSGSTGVPKGVIVPHHSVIRLVINTRYVEIRATDCFVHCSNPAFDASTFEIWGALLNGARVVVLPQEVVLDPERFTTALAQARVSIFWLTIGLFTQYLDALAPLFRQFRYVITGGDVLKPEVVQRVIAHGLPEYFLNAYGPTECTTFSSTYRIEAADQCRATIPIGRPITNTQIYILDAQLQPVPVGEAGEICIGGEGIALGYLSSPELTAQKFVHDPYSQDPQARLYRSGDSGRWRPDGTIEFLGRHDRQVKIRGFRIELAEIESHLLRDGGVDDAAVIVRDDASGQKRLIAYITGCDRSPPNVEDLRARLAAALPEYMVPSAFVVLEHLPLTVNGKLDRDALPEPRLEAYAHRQYEAPRGERETLLAEIWCDVLRIERVGRADNFFALGGHSLLVVEMMERVRRAGLSSDIARAFDSPTLADFASSLSSRPPRPDVSANLIPLGCERIEPWMVTLIDLDARQLEQIVRAVPGGAANIQDIYPLAPLQEGILFHHLMDERTADPYVLETVFSVSSRERLNALIAAFQSVLERNDVLRTAVLWDPLPQPVQVVCRHAVLPVQEVKLESDLDPIEYLREHVQAGGQALDLRRAPLMRLSVMADRLGSRWYGLLQIHHFVCDNEALDVIFNEVLSYLEGRSGQLPKPQPYRTHIAQVLDYSRAHPVESFFREKLEDFSEPNATFGLSDVRRAADGAVQEARHTLELNLSMRLRSLARRLSVSVATVFHAAWAIVVARTSDRKDVVYGTVLLGRLQGGTGENPGVGLFINTLPLRLQLSGLTAADLIEQTRRELVDLLAHEPASLALAQRCSGVGSQTPLFTTLLNYRHRLVTERVGVDARNGVAFVTRQSGTHYPITLSVDDLNDGFMLTAQTDPRIEPNRVLGYFSTALRSLVEAVEEAPSRQADTLSILPESERRRILETFNAAQALYPRTTLVQDLFDEQVRRVPDSVAVVCEDERLTYESLNRRANQLAHYLHKAGVEAEARVAVYLERGVDLVAGLLAVLKAGGAYVPLDIRYPRERLAHALQDSTPVAVLTQERLRGNLQGSDVRIVALDTDADSISRESDADPVALRSALQPDNLAYVIYTSGTTGTPKGVMVEHRSLTNLVLWHRGAFNLSAGCRTSCVAAIGFDAATWEIWPALTAGGTLSVSPAHLSADPEALLSWWAAQSLDVSFLPTPIAELAFSRGIRNSTLRTLLVGGDRLRSRPSQGVPELINNYGPTESTVVATSGRITGNEPVLHIGKPIANARLYILDGHGQPVPIGVAGELYIGGAGVARGYLNRPELTAERFLRDPFVEDAQARMYRTGDLVRWRADGTIEYLGRNDGQVKVRGYRIELGEIEATLLRHAQIKEAVVTAEEDGAGEKHLIAYITLLGGVSPSAQALRENLRAVLPEYMVPGAFVTLDQLPLTPNGKLDRRALPKPTFEAYASGKYVAPQSEIEQLVARTWEELLHVERVGREDNFFELGGHSLLATRMMSRIRAAASVEVPLNTLFEFPTVAQLSARLEEARQTQLATRLEAGGEAMQRLLERVASMPESKVKDLMSRLRMGERS